MRRTSLSMLALIQIILLMFSPFVFAGGKSFGGNSTSFLTGISEESSAELGLFASVFPVDRGDIYTKQENFPLLLSHNGEVFLVSSPVQAGSSISITVNPAVTSVNEFVSIHDSNNVKVRTLLLPGCTNSVCEGGTSLVGISIPLDWSGEYSVRGVRLDKDGAGEIAETYFTVNGAISLPEENGSITQPGVPVTAPVCDLIDAFWSQQNASDGDLVSLIVTGNNCTGQAVQFTLYEDDFFADDIMLTRPNATVFDNGTAISSWEVEFIVDGFGNPEFYFIAETESGSISSSLLNVFPVRTLFGEEFGAVEPLTSFFCPNGTECDCILQGGTHTPNLIRNPGFENNPWISGSANIDGPIWSCQRDQPGTIASCTWNTTPNTDLRSVSLVKDAQNTSGFFNWGAQVYSSGHRFDVGKQYTLSAYVKAIPGYSVTLVAIGMWNGSGSLGCYKTYTPQSNWTRISCTTSVITDPQLEIQVFVRIPGGVNTGAILIDDIQLEEGVNATSFMYPVPYENNSGTVSCCGDNVGEYFISDGSGIACCDSSTDASSCAQFFCSDNETINYQKTNANRIYFLPDGSPDFYPVYDNDYPGQFPTDFVDEQDIGCCPGRKDCVYESQCSAFKSPSPQIGWIIQELEHPSPSATFPSSHSSPVSIMPFPHCTSIL